MGVDPIEEVNETIWISGVLIKKLKVEMQASLIPSSCMSMLVFSRFLARATSLSVTLVQIRILDRETKTQLVSIIT